MHIIVLASQKGGVGKTTIATHLAVEAGSYQASKVAVVDADPQAGLLAWWNVRDATTPQFAKVAHGLVATLRACRDRGYACVVIDTPPALTAAIRDTVALASLVVVPVQPSPNDLRAVAGTVALVRSVKRPMVFVLNRTRAGTRLTADAAVALSQHGTVAPTFLQDRQDFRASMTDGRTAGEVDPRSKSAAEVSALWHYISNRLENPA